MHILGHNCVFKSASRVNEPSHTYMYTCTHAVEYVYVYVWIPAWPSLKIAIHLDSRSVAKLFTSAKENRETRTIYDRIGHILFRGAHIFLFVQSMKLQNIKTICHCQAHV